jgi:predicted glycosyltransferase
MPIHEGARVKIWYDAGTGKQVRYGVAIAKRLRAEGHEIILTTRSHPDTLPMAESLGELYHVVGRYNPKTLQTRLKNGSMRQLSFCKTFEKNAPDVAVSHGSVDQTRVAFGLGKTIILTVDTPYADAVHRLTLPLSKYIVMSKAIPQKIIQKYNVDAEIISFDGVDEVAWVKDFKPCAKYDFCRPLIVVRQFETKAVYAKNAAVDMVSLAKKLTKLGTVVFLSRYHRRPIKGLVVPKGFIDSLSLVAQADLFVGVGGTITREAALQGTPAISVNILKVQHVNDFLQQKGFPIFKSELSQVPKLAGKLVGSKNSVKHLSAKLANPVDIIADLVSRIDEKT